MNIRLLFYFYYEIFAKNAMNYSNSEFLFNFPTKKREIYRREVLAYSTISIQFVLTFVIAFCFKFCKICKGNIQTN